MQKKRCESLPDRNPTKPRHPSDTSLRVLSRELSFNWVFRASEGRFHARDFIIWLLVRELQHFAHGNKQTNKQTRFPPPSPSCSWTGICHQSFPNKKPYSTVVIYRWHHRVPMLSWDVRPAPDIVREYTDAWTFFQPLSGRPLNTLCGILPNTFLS